MSFLNFKQIGMITKCLNKCLVSLFLIITLVNPLYGMESTVPEPTPIGMLTDATHGAWTQYDKHNTPIILEWERFDGTTMPYIERLRSLAHVKAITLAKHMEVVAQAIIDHPGQLEHISDVADKKALTEMCAVKATGKSMAEWYEQFMLTGYDQMATELATKAPDNTINFVVVAKESNGTLLGFVEFHLKPEYATPEYPIGNVELEPLGVLTYAQKRNLGRLLAFSILKLRPETKRIFLATMQDNKDFYTHLKFTPYGDLGDLGLNFEYIVPLAK